MCFIRRTIAYLCLNLINFEAVDFSERSSEEVIHFFDAQCIHVLLFASVLKLKKVLYTHTDRLTHTHTHTHTYTHTHTHTHIHTHIRS